MTNWPWPLDGVQQWFENLWNQIISIPSQAANLVWNVIPDFFHNIFSNLWAFFASIGMGFWAFVRDPVTFLKTQLGWVWQIIPPFISQTLQTLWAFLTAISADFTSFIRDPISFMRNIAAYIWQITPDFIKQPLSYLVTAIGQLPKTIQTQISGLWSSIQTGLSNISSGLSSAVTSLTTFMKNDVFTPLQSGLSNISSALSSSVANIQNNIQQATQGFITAVSAATSGLRTYFDSALSGVVSNVTSGLAHVLQSGLEWLFASFASIMGRVGSFIQSNVITPIYNGLIWLTQTLQSLITSGLQRIFDALTSKGHITPEGVWAFLPTALTLSSATGLTAIALTSVASTKVAGTGLDLSHLGNFITKYLGPDAIIDAVLGGITAIAFATPARYYVNAITTPVLPDIGLFQEALSRGLVTQAEFIQHMKYHGFNEQWYPIFEKTAYRPISPSHLQYVADSGVLEPDQFKQIFRDAGYSPANTQYMAQGFLYAAGKTERNAIISQVITAYKEGFITKQEMIDEIAKAKQILDVNKLAQMHADWAFFFDTTKDKYNVAKEAYHLGYLSDDEFKAQLANIIVDPVKRDILYQLEYFRKTGKAKPQAPAK